MEVGGGAREGIVGVGSANCLVGHTLLVSRGAVVMVGEGEVKCDCTQRGGG